MEAKPTASSYGQIDGELGAGGKLRKPPARKSQSTPYDRPSSSQHGRGWWLSKLVDPACRLVSSGATMILPSFLYTTPSVAALPPTENLDKQEAEVTPHAESNDSIVGAPQFSERPGPSELAESEKLGPDEPNGIENNSELSGIEHLIKGKTFTRDEINRLTEILSSRVSDFSDVEGRKRNEILTSAGGNIGDLPTPFSKASDKGNQKDLKKVAITSPMPVHQTVPDEIGASPIEIAKAYMGSRLSEYGPGPSDVSSKGETAQQLTDEFALKPYIPSSAPRLSTCWPGAMAQEQHGYTTPNERSRHGLHDFPRTPYSRTIYSKSTAKSSQMQTDSKYVNSSPNYFKQSQAPIFEQVKYRNDMGDNSYGSVGPIRRLRVKYSSEVRPRGSIFSKYSKDVSSAFKQPIVSQDNQSDVQKNLQLGETSISKQQPEHLAGNMVGYKPLSNPSANEAVKRILNQLEKHKPTPQEKMNELKLASAWRKSPTEALDTVTKENKSVSLPEGLSSHKKTDFTDSTLISKGNIFGAHSKSQGDLQEGIIKAKETVDASTTVSSKEIDDSVMRSVVGTGILFPFKSTTASRPTYFEERASQSIAPKPQNSEQFITTSPDASMFEPLKKPPLHSSGARPNLPHISVGRRDPGRSVSSDNGTGFTFPVSTSSSTLSEPPTPSVMPFSSGGVASQPKDLPTIPTYSFGSNKSTPHLVFSFPSTSNAPARVDAGDLKFNFGSDKKRLSFGSVGKNAICY